MLNTFYRSIKIHDIENSLKDISDNIDSDKLSTVLKNVANDKQICITLCTQDGSVIYSIDVLPNCIIHELSSYRLARAYELTVQNGGTFIERTMFNERKSQFFLGETDDPNQIESVIYTKIATTKSGENILILLNTSISRLYLQSNIESTVALDYCDYDCAGGHYGTVACKKFIITYC